MLPAVHWSRIENSVGVGMPDLHGCWKGKELWFELKIHGGAPTRPSQNVWHLRRKRAGGKSYRLTYNPKKNILYVAVVDIVDKWLHIDDFPFTANNMAMFVAAL
jgi:hypothetical protein